MLADRVRALFRRLNLLLNPKKLESELDEELSFHLAMRAKKQRSNVSDPGEAGYAARRRFGNVALVREKCREAWTMRSIENFIADIRYSLRSLSHKPAFAAIGILTLATGIAANTTIFGLLYAVLLRPLNYPHPEQLVALFEKRPKEGMMRNFVSPADFFDWREQAKSFSGMSAMIPVTLTYLSNDEPQRIRGFSVSPNFFEVAGVRPIRGRSFTGDEETVGRHMVVVVTHGFWMDRLGGDPDAVGRTLILTDKPYTVIGILPKSFYHPTPDVELFAPLAMTNEDRANRGSHFLSVIARLKPGVSHEQAQNEMNVISANLESAKIGHFANVVPLQESLVSDYRSAILFLSWGAGILLLIACINAANLFLARSIARNREWSIRAAVGASRARLIRQMTTEGLLVAFLSGALAIAISALALQAIRTTLAQAVQFHAVDDIRLNTPVLLMTALVCAASAIIFSVVPALRTIRPGASSALQVKSSMGEQGRLLKRGLVMA